MASQIFNISHGKFSIKFDGEKTLFYVANKVCSYALSIKLTSREPFKDPLESFRFRQEGTSKIVEWRVHGNNIVLSTDNGKSSINQIISTSKAPKLKEVFKDKDIEFSFPKVNKKEEEKSSEKDATTSNATPHISYSTEDTNPTMQPVSILITSPGCNSFSITKPPACINARPSPSSFSIMKPSPPNSPVPSFFWNSMPTLTPFAAHRNASF